MAEALIDALAFVVLALVGDAGVAVDLERGRVRSMESERKRLSFCEFFVGETGVGGIGMLVISTMAVDGMVGSAAEKGAPGSCRKTEV